MAPEEVPQPLCNLANTTGTTQSLNNLDDTTGIPESLSNTASNIPKSVISIVYTNQSFIQNDTSTNSNDSANFSTTTQITVDTNDSLSSVLQALDYVNYIFVPSFLVFGILGNLLAVIVMNTKRYPRSTSRYILIALACFDSVVLLTQPFNKMFVMKLFGRDYRALSNIGCKVFFIIFRTSKMASSWFVVFLCAERFIAVWFPLKAKLICTKRTALVAIVIVLLALGTYTSVWSYASQIKDGVCFNDAYDVTDMTEKLKFGSFLIAACTLYNFLPTFIIAALTPLIIVKLTRHAHLRRKITASRLSKINTYEIRITIMLLGIVFSYIVLVGPVTMLHFLSYVYGLHSFGDNATGFLIFRDISQILEQLNYAINFFLYVFTNKLFREGLMNLLCCTENTRKRNTSNTIFAIQCHHTDTIIPHNMHY